MTLRHPGTRPSNFFLSIAQLSDLDGEAWRFKGGGSRAQLHP